MTVGTINGGNQANIIANKVTLTGTLRLFSLELSKTIGKIMENIIKSITDAYGASYNFELQLGDTPLINDIKMIDIAKKSAIKIVSEENVKLVPRTLLGEDFACYTKIVPSAFISLGVGFANRTNFSLHNSKFDIDEASLPIGTAVLAQSAIDFLISESD
jgi:amidohydrolase